jgi:hypothetical protein
MSTGARIIRLARVNVESCWTCRWWAADRAEMAERDEAVAASEYVVASVIDAPCRRFPRDETTTARYVCGEYARHPDADTFPEMPADPIAPTTRSTDGVYPMLVRRFLAVGEPIWMAAERRYVPDHEGIARPVDFGFIVDVVRIDELPGDTHCRVHAQLTDGCRVYVDVPREGHILRPRRQRPGLRSQQERSDLAGHAMALAGHFLDAMNSAENPGAVDCGGVLGWHVGTVHFRAEIRDWEGPSGPHTVQPEPEPLFLLMNGHFATTDSTSTTATPPRRRWRSNAAAPSHRLITGSHRLGMPMGSTGANPWLQLNDTLPRLAAEHGVVL